MKVRDMVQKLGLKVFSGESGLENEIAGGYVSDLLSDVMGNTDENFVWMTLQTHKNIMAVASLKELAAIIIVKGLQPDEDTIAHSNEEGVPLLGTDMETFEISGKLYGFLNN
ncbi:serine kinase [Natronoflexus pectinivorans]|uniref:HPr serine kinase-like protein n=1 Tax=Natronoflexus pectinivorans TaxID=682526 RepID=A0A4R2GPJ0_9BACT|nr:serine kinase [Natronoflexus pectinivorans]TCO09726.1 HPr serine kinase-like protein [Natronoflexus pectinivorans]